MRCRSAELLQPSEIGLLVLKRDTRSENMLHRKEVAKHNTKQSCWIIIQDQVYDMTDYLYDHPGGPAAILRNAGKDATEEFVSIHPGDTLQKHVPTDKCLGPIDPNSALDETPEPKAQVNTKSELASSTRVQQESNVVKAIPLAVCASLYDIEAQARRVLSRRAYIYFSSGSEDLSSLQNDFGDWNKIRFRPRVLRNVAKVDMSRNIMGYKSALPIFIAPTALVKLAHPDGELSLLRAAAKRSIPYCVSSLASVSHEDLCSLWQTQLSTQTSLFFQLYVAKEEEKARERIRLAKKLGYKALVVTVDTPVVGKREDDQRDKAQSDYDAGILMDEDAVDFDPEVERPILRGVNSSTLNWNDLKWIQEEWGNQGPIVLKGIGCAEDAKMAETMGIKHLYLSNHGGRQIASAPSSISTLLEIRKFYPEVLESCTIYLDGGLRRGSDIVKAICLGATAVAMGRPFLYGLGTYGVNGVVKAIQILSDEIETTMRLLGVTKLGDLKPEMVNARRLERSLVTTPGDYHGLGKL